MSESAFYTSCLIRRPSPELLQLRDRYQAHDEPAAAKLSDIEYHLTRGHELFHQRRYQEALREYKITHASIYQLVEPSFTPEVAQGSDVNLPVRQELFRPLLASVFALLDRVPDSLPAVIVQSPEPIDEPVDRPLQSYRALGLATESVR